MKIPIYVVTGFLSTGKTTFLNQLLKEKKDKRSLLLQWESGMQIPQPEIKTINFSFPDEENLTKALDEIHTYLQHHYVEELWIEWNGLVSLDVFFSALTASPLEEYCKIEHIYYMATTDFTLTLLGPTGNIPIQQLVTADTIILRKPSSILEGSLPSKTEPSASAPLATTRSTDNNLLEKSKSKLKVVAPQTPIFVWEYKQAFPKNLFPKKNTLKPWALGGIALVAMAWYIYFGVTPTTKDLHSAFAIFSGILLQALPFLATGIMLSSLIQNYLKPSFLEGLLGKGKMKGFLFALLGGFCFPLCDCATVPLFKGLTDRKVPVSVALFFMLVSPIINPIVIFSTYYAFIENVDMMIVRTGLGILLALLISLTFINYELPQAKHSVMNLATCRCEYNLPKPIARHKLTHMLYHSQQEFFQTAGYLIAGAFLSVSFQVFLLPQLIDWPLKDNIPLSIAFMMVVAFFLALCSTSDSMIGRVFSNYFSTPAILAFLLLGPMLDIKNFLLLKALLPKAFVYRLLVTTIIVCFGGTLLFSYFIQGVN